MLVTRPAHQAQTLCDMINHAGGQALALPVIEIVPLDLSASAEQKIKQIAAIDYAVFISPNAVQYGLKRILAHGKIPDKLKLVSIGRASAQKLQQLSGRPADIVPQGQYNSETLLAHKALQSHSVRDKKILIFRGTDGRELLADVLRERGADVSYAPVYQRVLPHYSEQCFMQIWSARADIITLTSNEGLNNLIHLCHKHLSNEQLEQLWQCPLVVVTDKMRQTAQTAGFKNNILIAHKASNEALLEAVERWLEEKGLQEKGLSEQESRKKLI